MASQRRRTVEIRRDACSTLFTQRYHFHRNHWAFYYSREGDRAMSLEEGPVPIHPEDTMICPPERPTNSTTPETVT